MCGINKSRYIPDILYVYNKENPNNEIKLNKVEENDRIEKFLRNKKPYSTLEKLYEND